MIVQFKRYGKFLSIFLVSLVLIACQSSEDKADNNSSERSGKVAIVITDAPSDEFSEINLTITKIELLQSNDEDGEKVEIFNGEETIDLLALENYSELFALSSDVPVGTYKKIRLILKKENGIELVKRDVDGNISELHYPKVNGNGKLDLNAKENFEVIANETLFIQLDIDANKSINIVQTGNGKYQFRPVVFVDVITEEFSGKLVRYQGEVRNLDRAGDMFDICLIDSGLSGDVASIADLCLLVDFSVASVFDHMGDELLFSGIEDGQIVSVVGFLKKHNREINGIIEYGKLVAQVIHVGNVESFSVISGLVNGDLNETEDTFNLISENNLSLHVVLNAKSKFFSKSGDVLTRDSIAPNSMLEIHGVYDVNDASIFYATLVIIEPNETDTSVKLYGTVVSTTINPSSLVVATNSGDISISVAGDAMILSVNTALDSSFSEAISLGSLVQAQRVEIYGVRTATGGYLANLILAVSE